MSLAMDHDSCGDMPSPPEEKMENLTLYLTERVPKYGRSIKGLSPPPRQSNVQNISASDLTYKPSGFLFMLSK